MKWTCEQNDLMKTLQSVVSVTEKKTTMPILANILMDIKDNVLTVYGTDLEISVESSCPVNSEVNGKICTASHTLIDIIKQLPSPTVNLEKDEKGWLNITSGKAHFRVASIEAGEFPEMPRKTDFNFFTLKKETLLKGIEYTSYAMSTDDVRANLNGILLEMTPDNHLTMVATDGHRLALYKNPLGAGENLSMDKKIILPRKGITELKKILNDDDTDSIQVSISPATSVFSSKNNTIFMKLVVGDFPEYSKVIPQGERKTVTMQKNDLKESLKRVSLLSEGKSKCVKMQFKPNELHLSANSPELGEAKEDMTTEFNGPEMMIGFNARYLLDALSVVTTDKVRLQLDHDQSPGVVMLPDNDMYVSVIMPMRI